ncbi:hypothetical protein [Streptomyces sp. NPDC059466]
MPYRPGGKGTPGAVEGELRGGTARLTAGEVSGEVGRVRPGGALSGLPG